MGAARVAATDPPDAPDTTIADADATAAAIAAARPEVAPAAAFDATDVGDVTDVPSPRRDGRQGAAPPGEDDVLGFAAANVAPTGELAEALAFAQGIQDGRTGLGWLVVEAEGRTMLLESGSTPGFSSAIVLDRTWGLVVVVLASTAGVDVLDLALRTFAPSSDSLQREDDEPTPRAVPSELLQPFVGTYAMPDADVVLATTDGGNGLVARVDGGDPIPLVPTGPDSVVVADGDSTIRFDRVAEGRCTGSCSTS